MTESMPADGIICFSVFDLVLSFFCVCVLPVVSEVHGGRCSSTITGMGCQFVISEAHTLLPFVSSSGGHWACNFLPFSE